ncbi:HTH domain-containing protein [Pseudescherichia sp.]
MSPKTQAYLVWLRRHPTSTIADMATRFGVTTRTVERQLQTLQK